jgi:two-component system, NarL family, response regulator DevR
MSETGEISVFLLGDHEQVRRGVRAVLEAGTGIRVVGESGWASEGARWIPTLRPDVAVLDGRMLDGSGIEVCRRIRSADPGIAAVILTSYDDDEALFSAIMAGAAGYVLKQVRGTHLVDTVRSVAAGQSLLDPVVASHVLARVVARAAAESTVHLSEPEERVLVLVGQGFTNREIAGRLGLDEEAVEDHLSALLAKLAVQAATRAATAAGTGGVDA